MKGLIDEMYPPAMADGLRAVGIDAVTVDELRLTGATDHDVFRAAIAGGRALLTENVGDFTRIAAEQSTAGGNHPGLLIALSSRFSRRPAGIPLLVAAVQSVEADRLDNRVVYLRT